MTSDLTIRNSTAEFLIFQSQAKEDSIEVKFIDGTVWLSQKMIAKLFDKGRSTITEHLLSIYKSAELDETIKSKIKPLWKKIHKICSQEKDNHPQFYESLSKLPEWLALVDKIDEEIYDMVQESIKNIKNAYDTWFLIECLSKHVTTTPKYAGGILLGLLENNIYPDYKQENIIEIISESYAHSKTDIANKICNIYLSKGFYFLKPVFDKNQSGIQPASKQEASK